MIAIKNSYNHDKVNVHDNPECHVKSNLKTTQVRYNGLKFLVFFSQYNLFLYYVGTRSALGV